jgi:phosphomevalonate kinase
VAEDVVLRVLAPGHGEWVWSDEASSETKVLPFAEGLVENLLAKSSSDTRPVPGAYTLNSDALYEVDGNGQRLKLGLGSSAASTVSLAGAMRLQRGENIDQSGLDEIYRAVQETHRQIQGLGSGADVAASTFGGVLAYRWSDADLARQISDLDDIVSTSLLGRPGNRTIQTQSGSASLRHLTPTFPIIGVWTGAPASTTQLVGATNVFAANKPQMYRDIVCELAKVAENGIDAWASDDRDSLAESMIAGCAALEKLGREAGVELVTEAHRALAEVADAMNAVSKPTGAGGGDLAWVLGPADAEPDEVVGELRTQGFSAWRFDVAPTGLEALTPN